MAEIRSVSVHLDADVAGYIAKMKLAGAATDSAFNRSGVGISATNTKLQTTERTLGKTSVAARRLGSDMDNTRVKVDTGARSLDRYSGRLGIIADLILGLGPGLVPIAAEAVPLTAALGTNLVAVGAGLGVAKLGFLGVGDALKAVNKAAVEPTAANLEAARVAMQGLSPEARDFVRQLQGLKPVVTDLRNVAAGGLLPGLGRGIDSLRSDLPIIRSGVRGIAQELGDLGAQTGEALASDRWRPFLRFVSREAPLGLGVMGHAIGDVLHGLLRLLMDFAPTTHDIDRAILRIAQDFDKWASSVGRTKGFQDFLAYLRENGPRVVDLLANTATAIVDIARAAAPLGGPVLDTLNALLKVIDAIANSDLGTPIFAGLIALRLFTRAQQLWAAQSTSSIGKFIADQKAAAAAIRETQAAQQRIAPGADWSKLAPLSANKGYIQLRSNAIKAGAAAAGVGLIASGLTDKLNLTNTATLALAGSLAGPWGAAAGGAVGLLLDMTSGSDQFKISTSELTETLNQQTGAITSNTEKWVAQQLQQQGVADAAQALGVNLGDLTKASLGNADAQDRVSAAVQSYEDHIDGSVQRGQIYAKNWKIIRDAIGTTSDALRSGRSDVQQMSKLLGHNAATADAAAQSHRALARDLKAERSAAVQAVGQWKAFGKSLDDTHKSLGQFIHDLARQAAALRDFGQNALQAARRGLDQGLIKSLRDAGPEGALRMRQLANASQTQIARANQAWRSWSGAIDSSTNALAHATSKQWVIRVQNAQAMAALRALSSELNSIRSKTITVTTLRTTGGHVTAGNADGGTIGGPRHPYGDKVLSWLAPGEEVISNRRGQADRFRADRAAGRIPRYADGGTVDNSTTATTGNSNDLHVTPAERERRREAQRLNAEMKKLTKSLAESTKELDKERQHRQELGQQRQQFIATVKQNFTSDFLGVMGGGVDNGIWSGTSRPDHLLDPASVLRDDIRDARQYTRDIRRLRRQGASRGLLSTVDTLDEAEQLSDMSPAQLRRLSRLYEVRQRAARAAGVTLGNIEVGKQIGQSNKHLSHIRDEVHHLNVEIRELKKEQAKNAKRTGDAVGKEINHGARTAARRRRPNT